jgi:hypothetical protein
MLVGLKEIWVGLPSQRKVTILFFWSFFHEKTLSPWDVA